MREIYNKMEFQTNQALILTNLCLFIVDFRQGITPTDIYLSKYLKKTINE